MYLCFGIIIQGKIHFSDNSHSFSYMGAFKHIINFRCVSYLPSKVSWPSLGNVPLKELPRLLVFKREFQSLYQMFGKLSNDLNIFFLPAKRSQVSCKFQFSSNLHILVWQWITLLKCPNLSIKTTTDKKARISNVLRMKSYVIILLNKVFESWLTQKMCIYIWFTSIHTFDT